MKRSICSVDDYLPVANLCPSAHISNTLNSINQLTKNIDDLIRKKKRTNAFLNSIHSSSSTSALPSHVDQKVLRIFIRHEFHPSSTSTEKPHFILYIEGLLLQSTSAATVTPDNSHTSIGSFFNRVQVQIDKKYNVESQSYDWKYDSYPIGATANGYRIKIKCPKVPTTSSTGGGGEVILPCRISLSRSHDVNPRYNISDQLRNLLLPNIRIDPTEKEVLLAVWQYILTRNLCGGDRKMVVYDDNLRELFACNTTATATSFPISSLKQKIQIHLVVAQPVIVEYLLHSVNTVDLVHASLAANCVSSGGGRWSTAAALSKIGGKVFDIEVDAWNKYSIDMIQATNALARKEFEVEDKIRMYQEKLSYLAGSMHQLENAKLPNIINLPRYGKDEGEARNILPSTCFLSIYDRIKYRSLPENYDVKHNHHDDISSSHKLQYAVTNSSSLHALTGYLDIGSDALFVNKSDTNYATELNKSAYEIISKTDSWVVSTCRQLIQSKAL